MTPESSVLEVSAAGGVATIRLSRRNGNAINSQLAEALHDAFRDAAADDSVAGVLLASRGSLFCPGLDLRELSGYTRPAMAAFLETFSRCLVSMYEFEKPVVAAVAGHALAGGCVLALTADWRVLGRDALIGLNEVRIGVPLPWGVTQILREGIVRSRLEEVALLGRNYSNEDAVATGLAHEVHPAPSVEDEARVRLAEFAEKDRRAFAATKRYLRSGALAQIRTEDAARAEEFLDGWFSEGTQRRRREILALLDGKERRHGG